LFCLFTDGAGHCAGFTFLGRKQAHGIAVKLYNNDRKNENVEQKNFLIFPLELSRTISTLIQATDNHEVRQLRMSFGRDINIFFFWGGGNIFYKI
jgi:hypothetical protein